MSFGKFKDSKNPTDAAAIDQHQEPSRMNEFVKARAEGSPNKASLGKGSRVVGQIFFEGAAEVDGAIEGEVISEDSLVVGKSAVLKAKITGQDVTVFGTVEGDINAAKRLALKHPAKVIGNIAAPVLSIEEGVVFQGSCRMEAPQRKPE